MNGAAPVRNAVIAGSGFYEMAGLEDAREIDLATPFGDPSSALVVGRLDGTRVAFLARHGKHHTLLPSEINHRANIFALKSLGVERILSASAVGSMRERIRPRDVVLVLSNSGETEEVKALLPHVRRAGAGVIAMTGVPDSSLARLADCVLDIGRVGEACPLGLAPTASTTAA